MLKKYGFKFSPSEISKFFEYNCDRYFIFNYLNIIEDDSSKENTGDILSVGEIMPTELEGEGFLTYSGKVWEDTLFKSLLKTQEENNTLKVKDFSILSQFDNQVELMNALDLDKDNEDFKPLFLYQPSFQIKKDPFLGFTGSNISEYKEKITNISTYPEVVWKKIIPDFILIEKNPSKRDNEADYVVNVFDVKLAEYPHLAHKMQVAFYVLLLNQFMKEYCLATSSNSKASDKSWKMIRDYVFMSPSGSIIKINNNMGYIYANRSNADITRVTNISSIEEIKTNLFSFSLEELNVFIEDFFENRICEIATACSEIVNMDSYAISEELMDQLKLKICEKLSFCIGENCDGCGTHMEDKTCVLNSKTCLEWGRNKRSIQLYPDMSRRAQNHIVRNVKKHASDIIEGVYGTENADKKVSEDELLSIDIIKKYIDYMRENSDCENSAGTKIKLLDEELRSNYGWAKYASFNNFKIRILPAMDARCKEEAFTSSSLISQEERLAENTIDVEEIEREEEDPKIFRKYSFDSMNIPSGQDVALFINLLTTIGNDGKELVYAYNIRLHVEDYSEENTENDVETLLKEVRLFGDKKLGYKKAGNSSFDIFEIVDTLDRDNDLGLKFVEVLYQIAKGFDSGNRDYYLQTYVFDNSEEVNFKKYLYDYYLALFNTSEAEETNNEELKYKLQKLIFWFQNDKMVSILDNQPDEVIESSIVAILHEIKKLFEIPAFVSTNLWNVYYSVVGKDKSLKNLSEQYCSTFSDCVSVAKIYCIENNTAILKPEKKKEFKKYIGKRVSALQEILYVIQHKYQNTDDAKDVSKVGLYKRVMPFRLPENKTSIDDDRVIRDKNIAKLIMLRENEFYYDYCAAKNTVMRSPSSAIAAGKIVSCNWLKQIGDNHYSLEIINNQSRKTEISEAYLIRCAKVTEGKREIGDALTYYNSLIDTEERSSYFYHKVRNVVIDKVKKKVSFRCGDMLIPSKNDRDKFFILEKPSKALVMKEIHSLNTLDAIAESNDPADEYVKDIADILYPCHYYSSSADMKENADRNELNEEVAPSPIWTDEVLTDQIEQEEPTAFSRLSTDFNFEISQWEAFKHLCRYNITLLQGPPGTGKTDYIGRSVITLAKIALQCNRPFRVLVSGMSHASINNAVKKIYTMAKKADAPANFSGKMSDNMSFFKDKDNVKKGFQIGELTEIEDLSAKWEGTGNIANEGAENICWRESLFSDDYKKISVHGTTCWQAIDTNPIFNDDVSNDEFSGFDLIIIDEASQLTVGQALILMSYGRISKTHFLIVGDNQQLSPIIRGDYKSEKKESDLYSSIFNFYMDENRKLSTYDRNYLYSLNTEFRMNEVLCNYSAIGIYNEQDNFKLSNKRYTAFDNRSVKNQEILYEKDLMDYYNDGIKKEDVKYPADWILDVMDPDYPLVVIYLDGAYPEKTREKEVEMISQIESNLFKHMMIPGKDEKYLKSKNELLSLSLYHFWGGNLDEDNKNYCQSYIDEQGLSYEIPIDTFAFGIVTPYHRQQHAILGRISEKHENIEWISEICRRPPVEGGYYSSTVPENTYVIDTVDKLQGQEREAIVVSYGIYDPEQVVAQDEFIYDYRRLNVALTRGKKKTILILSNAISERPIELIDTNNEEVQKGVSFLCGLKSYMQKDGEGFKNDCWRSSDNPDAEWIGKEDGISIEIYKKGLDD